MDHLLKKVRSAGLALRNRTFGAAALALTLSLLVCKVATQLRIVSVSDNGETQTLYTWEEDADKILAGNGFDVSDYDVIETAGFEGMKGSIAITRAFPVTVAVDGQEETVMTTADTVEEALNQAGVSLGRDDLIDPHPESGVGENGVITVTRRERLTFEREREIPYETKQVLTPLLAPGTTQVVEEGEEGLRVETFYQTKIEGELVDHKKLSEKLVQPPVDQTLLAGFPSRPVSSYDFAWEFDEEGVPMDYKYVVHNARAAGYSAPPGAGTASGRPAQVGNVAVDPTQIPYGSKLYIASADGSFVYGYAVAADTGTSLKNHVIDVDLFYDSYEGSAANGIKYVDIYILE